MKKRTTPRLHVIKPSNLQQDLNLYEEISITPYEAAAGTKKMINIPWGFYNRFFSVNIPLARMMK